MALVKPSYYCCMLDVSQQFIESEWTGVLESSLHTIWKVVTHLGCVRAGRVYVCVCVRERDCTVCLLSHVPARVRFVASVPSVFSAFCIVFVSFSWILHSPTPLVVIMKLQGCVKKYHL